DGCAQYSSAKAQQRTLHCTHSKPGAGVTSGYVNRSELSGVFAKTFADLRTAKAQRSYGAAQTKSRARRPPPSAPKVTNCNCPPVGAHQPSIRKITTRDQLQAALRSGRRSAQHLPSRGRLRLRAARDPSEGRPNYSSSLESLRRQHPTRQ